VARRIESGICGIVAKSGPKEKRWPATGAAATLL
jgi:hypothetical protein